LKTVLLIEDELVTWMQWHKGQCINHCTHPIQSDQSTALASLKEFGWIKSSNPIHVLLNLANESIELTPPNLSAGSLQRVFEMRSVVSALVKKNYRVFYQIVESAQASLASTTAELSKSTRQWLRFLQSQNLEFVSVQTLSQLVATATKSDSEPSLVVIRCSEQHRHVLAHKGCALFSRLAEQVPGVSLASAVQQSIDHLAGVGLVQAECGIRLCAFDSDAADQLDESQIVQPGLSWSNLLAHVGAKSTVLHRHWLLHRLHNRKTLVRWRLFACLLLILNGGASVQLFAHAKWVKQYQQQEHSHRKALAEAIADLRDTAEGLSENYLLTSSAFMLADEVRTLQAVSTGQLLRMVADALTRHPSIELSGLYWQLVELENDVNDHFSTHAQLSVLERAEFKKPKALAIRVMGSVDTKLALRDQQAALLSFRAQLSSDKRVVNERLEQSPLSNSAEGVANANYEITFELISANAYES